MIHEGKTYIARDRLLEQMGAKSNKPAKLKYIKRRLKDVATIELNGVVYIPFNIAQLILREYNAWRVRVDK